MWVARNYVCLCKTLCSPLTILLPIDRNYVPRSLTYSQTTNIVRLFYALGPRIAGEKLWTCSKTLLRPILLARSPTTSQTSLVLFLRFKYDCQHFGSYIGCNLVVSLVRLTPIMFKNLVATDFASMIVYDLCDKSRAVSVIDVRFSQFWIVHWL